LQTNLQTKTEEYYDYKEAGEEELWEKMKAYYKDYAGGVVDEQHN
jgi:hypothetical protein